MKKTARKQGPARSRGFEDYSLHEKRSALREYGPMAFGGIMLVMAFALAGHYMGQNAIAHNADPGQSLAAVVTPSSNIIAKGSLMPEGTGLEIVSLTAAKQQLAASGKGDIPAPPKMSVVGKTTAKFVDRIQIIPASVDLRETSGGEIGKKIALAPSKSKVEQAFRLKRSEKQADTRASSKTKKVIAQRRIQMAEENCLARAIYFEARSESELGQLAVAKVILNRVKDPEYPKTICGVVYQGSGRRNSCQFSFACDGLPDDVRSPAAWANSKRVAQKALAGDAKVAAIGTATNYHADYVRPKWAKSMKRLIKIGRHVFYEDS